MEDRKVMVLEDDERNRKCLESLVKKVDNSCGIYSFANVTEAYIVAMETTIDLFLIDIILEKGIRNDVSGMKFADKLRMTKRYAFTPIIFVTALVDYKMKAFYQTRYFGYLEKPYSKEEAVRLISKALEYPKANDDDRCVYFRKDGVLYAYFIKDIVYIENRNHKITLHTTKGKTNYPYKTCKEILRDLDSPRFIQCSRNAIINRSYIKHIDPTNQFIKLNNCESDVAMGPIYKRHLKERLGI